MSKQEMLVLSTKAHPHRRSGWVRRSLGRRPRVPGWKTSTCRRVHRCGRFSSRRRLTTGARWS